MIQIATYSDIGGRPRNEDTVRYREQGETRLCLVVADGLGGHGGGEQASSAAAAVICAGWTGGTGPDELKGLILEANQRVLSLQTSRCAMKTTVTALTLEPGRAVWAHVGDSRIYYFRNGGLTFQTQDHSAAQIGVMLGEITPDQIRFHEDRSRVLRALGQDGELKVDLREETLPPGKHAFLLCSDGFWEYVLEQEMVDDLAAAGSPEEWLDKMRARLSARAPEDNDNNSAAAVWVEEK